MGEERNHGNGSSPRLWGTLDRYPVLKFNPRFIPTLVGNTKHLSHCCSTQSVHPHACGEHAFAASIHARAVGSSPRLWGTQLIILLPLRHSRFIPTLVGNTGTLTDGDIHFPVHPHACGEHPVHTLAFLTLLGSSPRLWGTRLRAWQLFAKRRFIPTLVGNTSNRVLSYGHTSVHPHACGEHL